MSFDLLENFDWEFAERKKFCVIGVIKCGQVSLNNWIQQKFPGSEQRFEVFWKDNGPEEFFNMFWNGSKHERTTPIIITRNPIERIWSAFRYFNYRGTFKEFLLNTEKQQFGTMNPIIGSNYSRWLPRWAKFNPLVVSLEFMRKLPDFPQENITPHYYDQKPEDLQLAQRLLELEYRGEFWDEERQEPSLMAHVMAKQNP